MRMSLLKSCFFILFSAVACAIGVLCLWIDVSVLGNQIPEISLTEIVQESVLAVIVVIHFMMAKKCKNMRYCNILIGGFFLTMLIRELDAIFDLIYHGSWVWFALFSTLCTVTFPVIHSRETLAQLVRYTRIPYYGMMISGLLAILIFSRLIGTQALWHSILADGYARIGKNAVEEGSESFGYMLCLMASIGYFFYCRGTPATHTSQ